MKKINNTKTLSLRLEKHASNAEYIANHLLNHPAISNVWYPALKQNAEKQNFEKQMKNGGGVLSFELKSGFEACIHLLKNVKICTLTASLGTADTLIQHPASMTHAKVNPEQRKKAGISDGMIRLSVGLENPNDILSDLISNL